MVTSGEGDFYSTVMAFDRGFFRPENFHNVKTPDFNIEQPKPTTESSKLILASEPKRSLFQLKKKVLN